MAGSSRHSSSASPFRPLDYARAINLTFLPAPDHAAGVRWPRASRVVHKLFRVAPPPQRAERPKLRAVADIGDRSPVGEPVDAPPLLALLREGRVPDKRRRD